jgi:hypothetical protein
MPFASTKIFHPRWSENSAESTDTAMNSRVRVLDGTSEDWVQGQGPVTGDGVVLYDGPARVSYDLDRAITEDNADQVTSIGTVLVALPRAVDVNPHPGGTVQVWTNDSNGPLGDSPVRTLRILTVRESGYSWGMVLDCHESRGRSNG